MKKEEGWSYAELRVRWYVLASFVLIGLIWPPVVNLLAFGSLRRPPELNAADLSGVPPTFPDLHGLQKSDGRISSIIQNGIKGEMPRFSAKLNDADVNALVAFLRTLG